MDEIASFIFGDVQACGSQSAHAVEKAIVANKPKEDPEMEVLVDHISDLASKVLEIFEPMAAKSSNETSDDDNTYFVSFLLRDRKNKTVKHEDGKPRQRMVINNNFSGERMGTSQVFVETGPPPKQPPMHNIQLLSNSMNPSQGYQQSKPYQQPFPQQPQQHQIGLNYG